MWEDTGNLKRKHQLALCGELAVDLSPDRQQNEWTYTKEFPLVGQDCRVIPTAFLRIYSGWPMHYCTQVFHHEFSILGTVIYIVKEISTSFDTFTTFTYFVPCSFIHTLRSKRSQTLNCQDRPNTFRAVRQQILVDILKIISSRVCTPSNVVSKRVQSRTASTLMLTALILTTVGSVRLFTE